MWHRVIGYRLQWHAASGKGRVVIIYDDGGPEAQRAQFDVASATELAALGEILRDEEPIGFDPDTLTISTGDEPVGENE